MDKQSKLPFFAHFLEAQEAEEINAGITLKIYDDKVTLKYPSDSDETSKRRDSIQTMKYPSDSDESGFPTV